ncbi:hypothetical protein K443DRAFT_358760 [Laccaria amethystina LaAM-08-1]|uniref:Uncharacterized protein n=1 Tax=Laccaria amethystina LaAM-08-1 TaxID=1095629 RepID=A0A0C9XE37_9AGAR|nr:hypothetical protein K443DRAFT_358760 [Laccaria amethystina LaAM-08-1]
MFHSISWGPELKEFNGTTRDNVNYRATFTILQSLGRSLPMSLPLWNSGESRSLRSCHSGNPRLGAPLPTLVQFPCYYANDPRT